MITRFSFLLTFFLFQISFAQTDSLDAEAGDTIDVIMTDTSVLYVIKKSPVKIFQTVEIERSKEKLKIYLSLHGSFIKYNSTTKAQNNQDEYTKEIASRTTTLNGFATGATFWFIRKQNYYAFETGFRKFEQHFRFTPRIESEQTIKNRYGYFNIGLQYGKMITLRKNILSVLYLNMLSDIKLSTAGKTLEKDTSAIQDISLIKDEMEFTKVILCPQLHYKLMFQIKEIIIEAEPYAGFSLNSYTPKNEYYSTRRSYYGFRLGFVTKLN